jgi:hypothetical protein
MSATATPPTRPRSLAWIVLLGLGLGLAIGPGACGTDPTVVEGGALLLRITVPPGGGSRPEHLQLWTYDDGGLIFDAVRVPQAGALPAAAADGTLGTVLVQPGPIRGNLRLHVRALAGGARILDGVAVATAAVMRVGKLDLALTAALPNDDDGDDVPDAIDDCPARANPVQGGCGVAGDAGTDGAATGGAAGTSAGGAGGGAGTTGSGGSAGAGSGGANTGGMGTGGARVSDTGGSSTGGMRTGGVGTGGMGSGGSRTGGSGSGGSRTGGMGTGGAPKVLGVTCANMSECASGFCVDGVCCESTCDTPCRTCALLGRCLEVRRADDVPQCAGAMTCNNAARCDTN